MLVNGVARALIKNIPMELGGADIMPCKVDFLGLTDFPPTRLDQWYCDFNDDVWDARKAFRMQWRADNIIRFGDCNPQAKYAIKCFVAKCLDEKTKFSTMHNNARYLIRVANGAIERCRDKKFLFITANNILEAMKDGFGDIHSQLYSICTFKKFVRFMQDEMGGLPLVMVNELEKKARALSDIASLHHNQRHYPKIPDELFNGMMTMFYDVFHDRKAFINERLTAGIMLMETQLGLRKSELCALETDCLRYYLCDTGANEPFISYNCIKASRGDLEVVPIHTWCTQLCEETMKEYLNLRQRSVYADKTDFLYILDPRGGQRDGMFPVDPQTLVTIYMRMCGKYALEYVDKDWKGLNRVNINGLSLEGKYTIPPIHCYRTTVASLAAMQGLPYDYIECALSHDPNSEMGLGYYSGVTVPSRPVRRISVPEGHIDAFEDFIQSFKTVKNK